MTSKIWFDGNIINSKDANIPILTHGLHYSSSVFEGIRIYKGKPFMLNDHMERLIRSAAILDMKSPFDLEVLNQAALNIVEQNNIYYGYIRPLMWRGSENIKIAAPDNTIHTAIAAWSTEEKYKQKADLDDGYNITLSNWRRPSPESMPHESKCAASYTISTIAKHEALKQGFHDALLLDYRNYIAETTSSNIFFILENSIYTPIADCFLNGLTRQLVIKLAKELGFPIIEKHITIEDIKAFDDCFLTSTTLEIMPVNSIDQKLFYRSHVTKELYEKFIVEANMF